MFATGVSATADMGTLVEGVHGPTEVHVVLVDAERSGDRDDGDPGAGGSRS